mgnify:FL=1
MKRYLSDFKLSYEFVKNSIYDCLDGRVSGNKRWKRRDTILFISTYYKDWLLNNGYDVSLNVVSKTISEMIISKDKERLYPIVDMISNKIYIEIITKSITLDKIVYDDRFDKATQKYRRIGISSMKQQCLDYIAVNACLKMFNAKIGHYQCASLKFKGQQFGVNAIETWIRTNPKNCKWIFKCDIKKFYPSVNHAILKNYLDRDIKNNDIKYLLFTLIDTYEQGLCIGSYLCQFLANYFLSYAYHFVTEQLYITRRDKRINLVNHTLFYMDDIILIGSSKKNIKKASKELEKYLNDYLKLSLKSTYQLWPLDTRPIDMMGFKIYKGKTTIRKSIFNNLNKVFFKYKNTNRKMNLKDARKIVSYYGFIKNSFSKKYVKKNKINRTLLIAKEVISNEAKSRIQRETT